MPQAPIALSSFAASLVTIGLGAARLALLGMEDLVGVVLLADGVAFGLNGWLAGRHTNTAARLLPLIGAAGVCAMAFSEGGLFSEALYWLPFVLMLAHVWMGRRAAWATTAVVMLVPAILLHLALRENAFADPTRVFLHWLGLEGALTFGAIVAVNFVRWRERSIATASQERNRLQFVIDNLRSGIAVTNEKGAVRAVNARMLKVLGLDDADEVTGKKFVEVLRSHAAVDEQSEDSASAVELLTVGDSVFECRCDSIGTTKDPMMLWSLHEVTRRVRSYTELLGRLQRDDLTGLFNRNHLLDVLQDACQSEDHFAVMFMDLDGFKEVNDTLGHQVGDEVLVGVAKELTRALRAGDLICRVGGDEFCAVAYGVKSREQAGLVAQKLIEAVRSVDIPQAKVDVSIGIALFPDVGREVDELLTRADAAMYSAKRKGPGRFALARPSLDMTTLSPAS